MAETIQSDRELLVLVLPFFSLFRPVSVCNILWLEMERNQSFATATTSKTNDSKYEDQQLEYAGQHGKHIGISMSFCCHDGSTLTGSQYRY